MQMWIWAEKIVSGMYSSMHDSLNASMLVRAGPDSAQRKKSQQNPVAWALSEAATAITSA